MTVTTDIIFAIGVTGAGGAQGKLLAVGAAVAKVAKAVFKAAQQAEQFALTWDKMSRQQQDAALAMESAAKGLIDTHVALQSQVQLTEAGMGSNKKLMESIAKIAVDVGKKMGDGPEGLNQRVKQLTESISKGEADALKQYGIELRNTEGLLKSQAEITDLVIERAEGLTVELETSSEIFFALNNNVETTLGLMTSLADTSPAIVSALSPINDFFSELNTNLVDVTQLSKEYRDELLALRNLIPGILREIDISFFKFIGQVDIARELERRAMQQHREIAESVIAKGGSIAPGAGAIPEPQPIKRPRKPSGKAKQAIDKFSDEDFESLRLTGFTVAELDQILSRPEGLFVPTARGDILEITGRAQFGVGRGVAATPEDIALAGGQVPTEFAEDPLAGLDGDRNQLLGERIALLREQQEIEGERVTLLRELAQIAPGELSIEEKTELFEAEIEQREATIEFEMQRAEFMRQNITLADEFTAAIEAQSIKVTSSQFAMTASTQLFTDAMETSIKMAILGQENIGEAIRQQLASTLAGKAAEAAVEAAIEVAKGVSALAGIGTAALAPGHFAAAAKWVAVGTAAGVAGGAIARSGGGGTGGRSVRQSGEDERGVSTGATRTPPAGASDGEQQTITIHVDGSMSQLVTDVRGEFNNQVRSGQIVGWRQ